MTLFSYPLSNGHRLGDTSVLPLRLITEQIQIDLALLLVYFKLTFLYDSSAGVAGLRVDNQLTDKARLVP